MFINQFHIVTFITKAIAMLLETFIGQDVLLRQYWEWISGALAVGLDPPNASLGMKIKINQADGLLIFRVKKHIYLDLFFLQMTFEHRVEKLWVY